MIQDLTKRQLELLEALKDARGPLSRKALLRAAFGSEYFNEGLVNVMIGQLRRKGVPVVTVWGKGYELVRSRYRCPNPRCGWEDDWSESERAPRCPRDGCGWRMVRVA